MQYCYICFYHGTDLKSKLIQKITKCKYNHVFIRFWSDEWNSNQVIDIDERGVVQIPWHNTEYLLSSQKRQCVEMYEAPKGFVDEIIKQQDIIGDLYDWKGLFGGLFKLIILKVFGIKINKPWQSKGKLFCSEYVATLLQSVGYKLEPWLSSPSDIFDFAEKNLKRYEL
jgi:hypothetical protein